LKGPGVYVLATAADLKIWQSMEYGNIQHDMRVSGTGYKETGAYSRDCQSSAMIKCKS